MLSSNTGTPFILLTPNELATIAELLCASGVHMRGQSISSTDEWKLEETWIEDPVSIGSNATILCDVRIGKQALIGAGARSRRGQRARRPIIPKL